MTEQHEYVLGIDLGSNSLGWAALAVDAEWVPTGLLIPPGDSEDRPSMGVRIFEAGVNNLGESKEESRGAKRRTARLARRQTLRRARRMRRVFKLLQSARLLPPYPARTSESAQPEELTRDALLKELDRELATTWARAAGSDAERRDAMQRLPYVLRVAALDRALEPFELGRALYHLAQRRGFQSNRRSIKSRDDDEGAVKQGISTLAKQMAEIDVQTGRPRARTLGEYLLKLDPDQSRARRRWTARSMYQDEFERIWNAQVAHHPSILDASLGRRLNRALFHQRPLRSQKHLVGSCELENGQQWMRGGARYETLERRRAPMSALVAQRFRLLQRVNDLVVVLPDHTSRDLTLDERARLANRLQCVDRLTYANARAFLGLPRGAKFSIEAGGEKNLLGNQTYAAFVGVLGERWERLTHRQQDELVQDLRGGPDEQGRMAARIAGALGPWEWVAPSIHDAERLAAITLNEDYSSLSRRALAKLVPEMETGTRYIEAVARVYGERVVEQARATLPPVAKALGSLRNPVVSRSLTELRRVVNEIVRVYGRPAAIRIELARDLRSSAKARKQMTGEMRDREAERAAAATKVLEAVPGQSPTRERILRVLLWQECGGICPYTGRSIAFGQLFGGDIDIEHIIPFSRSLDDSFGNKTLCFADFNRNHKRNKTPFEAFEGDPAGWESACQRLERNLLDPKGRRSDGAEGAGMSKGKYMRFKLQGEELRDYLDKFRAGQLNDTRYASVKARQYLALLYGGRIDQGVDAEGRTRVQVGNGQVTAFLRSLHGTNRFLGGSGKNRADHRHHTVDAVIIALTSPRMLKLLGDASASAGAVGRLFQGNFPYPWPGFHDDLEQTLGRLVVSHRVDLRVRGPLHAEQIYSPRRDAATGALSNASDDERVVTHIRRPVESLNSKDIPSIVDPVVRRCVAERLAASGTSDPAKAFSSDRIESLPRMPNRGRDGQPGPYIRSVRVRVAGRTSTFGSGHRARNHANADNHHVEIYALENVRGKLTWAADVVSLAEAQKRRRQGVPIVRPALPGGAAFLFSFGAGDTLQMSDQDGTRRLYRVRSFSPKRGGAVDLELAWVTDARRVKEIRDLPGDDLRITSMSKLQSRGCTKVVVTPMGRVRRSRA